MDCSSSFQWWIRHRWLVSSSFVLRGPPWGKAWQRHLSFLQFSHFIFLEFISCFCLFQVVLNSLQSDTCVDVLSAFRRKKLVSYMKWRQWRSAKTIYITKVECDCVVRNTNCNVTLPSVKRAHALGKSKLCPEQRFSPVSCLFVVCFNLFIYVFLR